MKWTEEWQEYSCVPLRGQEREGPFAAVLQTPDRGQKDWIQPLANPRCELAGQITAYAGPYAEPALLRLQQKAIADLLAATDRAAVHLHRQSSDPAPWKNHLGFAGSFDQARILAIEG